LFPCPLTPDTPTNPHPSLSAHPVVLFFSSTSVASFVGLPPAFNAVPKAPPRLPGTPPFTAASLLLRIPIMCFSSDCSLRRSFLRTHRLLFPCGDIFGARVAYFAFYLCLALSFPLTSTHIYSSRTCEPSSSYRCPRPPPHFVPSGGVSPVKDFASKAPLSSPIATSVGCFLGGANLLGFIVRPAAV